VRNEPYKTHLAYVKERRSDEDGAALLEEALQKLKARRRRVSLPASAATNCEAASASTNQIVR